MFTEEGEMIATLRRLWCFAHPHYRRIRRKRHLEAVMREYGIPRKLATRITNHYFLKGNP